MDKVNIKNTQTKSSQEKEIRPCIIKSVIIQDSKIPPQNTEKRILLEKKK